MIMKFIRLIVILVVRYISEDFIHIVPKLLTTISMSVVTVPSRRKPGAGRSTSGWPGTTRLIRKTWQQVPQNNNINILLGEAGQTKQVTAMVTT